MAMLSDRGTHLWPKLKPRGTDREGGRRRVKAYDRGDLREMEIKRKSTVEREKGRGGLTVGR